MSILKEKSTLSLPTIKDMLEAGVHFGHETQRWNPHFKEFIYTKRGGFHIINIEITAQKLAEALKYLGDSAAKGLDILIVGTKRQARDIVREEAIRCGVHFVVNRWIGGQITNFSTVYKGIQKLREIEGLLDGDITKLSQQRLSVLRREWGRLDRLYGGVKTLDKLPDLLILASSHYEKMALREARVMNIPVIALVDSNADPMDITYPIPANDDAVKSIQLFIKCFADAISAGNKGKGVRHVFKDFSKVGIKEAQVQPVVEKKEVEEKKEEVVKEKLESKMKPVKKALKKVSKPKVKVVKKKKIVKKRVKKMVKKK